ncbi:MAG: hypothetical protein KDE09_09680 [Anaerolineales bacterium]|nr:hypothetical protein [Anaerolineales bacterium]MCB0026298.1 hypothetical protein [Anaerolineales bacterium]
MSTNIQRIERGIDPAKYALYMQDVAQTIQRDALQCSRATLPPIQRDLDLSTLIQQVDFFGHFKHQIALNVAEIIASTDDRVLAIYLFDDSINPDAETEDNIPIDATIHLLVQVTSRSAALEAFISSLDRALTQQLNDLSLIALGQYTSILDVIPVTEADTEKRRGYAFSLLSSWYAPPLKIWAKEGS